MALKLERDLLSVMINGHPSSSVVTLNTLGVWTRDCLESVMNDNIGNLPGILPTPVDHDHESVSPPKDKYSNA